MSLYQFGQNSRTYREPTSFNAVHRDDFQGRYENDNKLSFYPTLKISQGIAITKQG